jgi:hypothetical protein
MDRVARRIREGGQSLGLRQAVVVRFDTVVVPHTVTLLIGGSDQEVPDVTYLDSYAPTVNDTVWLLTNGTDAFVLGKLAGT